MSKLDTKTRVRGRQLAVGDIVEVWWGAHADRITALRRYNGPLCYLWPAGARLADFAISKVGMTIPNDELFYRL